MKKFCLFAPILLILILLLQHALSLQIPTFLAVPFVSEQEAANKTKGLTLVTDNSIASLIRFENTELQYDASTNTHFITVGTQQAGNFETKGGIDLYWLSTTNQDTLADAMTNNKTLSLLAIYQKNYQVINLSVSSLPLVCFDTVASGQEITIIDAEHSATNIYNSVTYNMNYHVRGATSALFEKTSYKVSLVNQDGTRNAQSLLGLRTDDDWNFNAVYSDITHIREAVTLDLLQQTVDSATTEHCHPQDSLFCELFIDDVYYGIYQVVEPMDTRQSAIVEDTDYLYKLNFQFVFGDVVYTLNDSNDDSFISVESYPDGTYQNRYDPLVDYLLFLEGDSEISIASSSLEEIGTVLDLENLIDLSIINTVFSLWDNGNKNVMIALHKQDDGSYLASREYFDFNYSLGDTYSAADGENTFALTTSSDPADISTDTLFALFENAACYDAFIALYQERYFMLRQSVLSEENILNVIAYYYTQLDCSGAYIRDTQRWTTPDIVLEEYNRLTAFVTAHLSATDTYVAQLT